MNTCNLLPRPRWIRHVGHNLEQRKETKLLSLSAANNITSLAVRFQRNEIEKEKSCKMSNLFPGESTGVSLEVPSFFLSFLNPCVLRHFSTLPNTKTLGSSTCRNFSHSYEGPRTAGNRLNIDKFHEKGRWQHINYEEGWVVTKS